MTTSKDAPNSYCFAAAVNRPPRRETIGVIKTVHVACMNADEARQRAVDKLARAGYRVMWITTGAPAVSRLYRHD